MNAEGYLPALVTSFQPGGAKVSITNFGDKVTRRRPRVRRRLQPGRASPTPASTPITVDPQAIERTWWR